MLENFLEKKKPYNKLQQKEKEILRLQENPYCTLDLYEGLPHESSYYSSSSIVVCSQILKPIDHVHFEEYNTLEAFLANITDIEYQWFAQKCTDWTRTTMADWEEGYFFNLKSAIHYRKFGDAIYSKMGHANPIKLMETLEMAHLQGNRAKVFNLLTSSQIVCPYSSFIEVELETPQVSMAPSLANSSLVRLEKKEMKDISTEARTRIANKLRCSISDEVLKRPLEKHLPVDLKETQTVVEEEVKIGEEIGASVCGGVLWSGLSSLALSSSLQEKKEEDPLILTSAKVEPKYDLVFPSKSDLDFRKKGLEDVTNIIEIRKQVFERRTYIVEKKGTFKLRFSHRLDSSYQDQMVDVPFSVPTVSSIRWLTNIEKFPVLNLFLPALSGGTFYFNSLGDTFFWIVGAQVRLSKGVEIVQRYCSCEMNKSKYKVICQKCGIRVKYKGLFISFFCTPHPEDTFVVRHPVFSAFPGSYQTGEMGFSFCGNNIRSDLAVVNFPDTWPYPSPLGSSPIGYLMRTFTVPLSYRFEPRTPFFHLQTGAQIFKKNYFPVELIYLFQKVPENQIGHLIMIYLVWLEENLSFYELYRMRGEREKEAYGYSRVDHQGHISLSKRNARKN